jgi:hypothetical protein
MTRLHINNVQKKMAHHRNSTTLQFAWDGIGGWCPRVVIPLPHHTVDIRMELLDNSPKLACDGVIAGAGYRCSEVRLNRQRYR